MLMVKEVEVASGGVILVNEAEVAPGRVLVVNKAEVHQAEWKNSMGKGKRLQPGRKIKSKAKTTVNWLGKSKEEGKGIT